MRTGQGNVRMLLSANPQHPRAHLTETPRENPDTPPMFCMLLRKYFLGGRILAITQPSMERLLEFQFETLSELGDRVERRLVLECIGRKANLIMLDGEGRITDCLRRVEGDLSARRPLMPGMFYQAPAPTGKLDPTAMTLEDLRRLVLEQAPEGEGQDKWLLDTFSGLSPLVARELEFQGAGSREGLSDRLERLLKAVKEECFQPIVLAKDEKPFDFTFMPVLQYGPSVELRRYDGFSQMLDDYYAQKEAQERVKQRGQDFIRSVTQARSRTAKKIANQEQDLRNAADRERMRQFGDIITSNFHRMEARDRPPSAPRTTTIPRAVRWTFPWILCSPLSRTQPNTTRTIRRRKRRRRVLSIQLEKNRRELDYLDSVLQMISLSEGDRDLQEIRQELMDNGYLKQHRRKMTAKGKQKIIRSKPMEFRSSAGLTILVGKNNSQNDRLTLKEADKRDIWLHTQKIHGSHVILKTDGGEPDERSLNEAAMLAAWFSQGRESGQVPVDYTPVRYVKKPAGAKPGFVIYNTYHTLYVTPAENLAKKLRVK